MYSYNHRGPRRRRPSLAAGLGVVAALSACARAQLARPAATADRLFVICVGDKFGYIDRSGAIAIAPAYSYAEELAQDRAEVWVMPREPTTDLERADPQLLARGGFIDRQGRFVVAPVFDQVGPFSDGLAVVGKDGRYGYVDRDGKVRLPIQYRSAERFSEGLAYVEDDAGRRFIDPTGKTVVDMSTVHWSAGGREVVVAGAGPFSEGLAAIRYYTPGEYGAEGWGFMNTAGRIVIEPRFNYAYDMQGGLALVSVRGEGQALGTDAIIDREGRYVIPPAYASVGPARDGRARFSTKVNGAPKYGFLSTRNEVLVPPRYDSACLAYSEGLCAVKRGGVWAFIDVAGNEVVALPPDTTFADEFHSGLSMVETSKGAYFIRRDGARAFEGWFASAGRFADGLAPVSFPDHTGGYIDLSGRSVYRSPAPCTFPRG